MIGEEARQFSAASELPARRVGLASSGGEVLGLADVTSLHDGESSARDPRTAWEHGQQVLAPALRVPQTAVGLTAWLPGMSRR
jgi:hypothetical protein